MLQIEIEPCLFIICIVEGYRRRISLEILDLLWHVMEPVAWSILILVVLRAISGECPDLRQRRPERSGPDRHPVRSLRRCKRLRFWAFGLCTGAYPGGRCLRGSS